MAEIRVFLSKLSGSAGQFTFQALKRPHHHEREGVDHHRETQFSDAVVSKIHFGRLFIGDNYTKEIDGKDAFHERPLLDLDNSSHKHEDYKVHLGS